MKAFFTVCLFAFCLLNLKAQTSRAQTSVVEALNFKELKHDFGQIQQNRPVTYNFSVVNTTNQPVKIDNVQASCGCTTPEWSRDVIQPGATATIKVGYNAAAEGSFSKTISVQYNGSQTTTLLISGVVYKSPATSAPVNASLSLFKQTNK